MVQCTNIALGLLLEKMNMNEGEKEREMWGKENGGLRGQVDVSVSDYFHVLLRLNLTFSFYQNL